MWLNMGLDMVDDYTKKGNENGMIIFRLTKLREYDKLQSKI